MNRYVWQLFFLFLLTSSTVTVSANPAWSYSSGDREIDGIRVAVRELPTGRETFLLRLHLMRLWAVSLQQQGASLIGSYLDVDKGIMQIVSWHPVFHGGDLPTLDDEKIKTLCGLIDRGYGLLEEIQRSIRENPPQEIKSNLPALEREPGDVPVDWPNYKGNPEHSGSTGTPGPVHGRIKWKFPVGLAWESQPVVEGNRIYLSSPGMRTTLHCVSLETGEVIWETKQISQVMGDQLYSTPSNSSTPVILKDHVLYREIGSRGNTGYAREVVFVDKTTGVISHQMEAGHVDYRAGYSPFTANEVYTVIPYGVQDIELHPPIAQAFNRIRCKDTRTGKLLWDFNIGPTFAEPVLEGRRIYTGTRSGYVYCLKADGDYIPASAERIAWMFKAKGAVNRKLCVSGDRVIFGCNEGRIYSLDKTNGKVVWTYDVKCPQARAFRHFTTPWVMNGSVFMGGADGNLYALDADNGKQLFTFKTSDWIRSRPVGQGNRLYVMALDGTLTALDIVQNRPAVCWQKKLSVHSVYADLTLAGDRLLFNDSDLYTYCVSTEGKQLWKHSLLRCFEQHGHRIFTDQIASGAFYQSKPTIVKGRVFVGTPSRFVYALDAYRGTPVWKFELGAAVSASPVYMNGRIYVGQQGGEVDFYCLDARDGRQIWSQNIGWVWGSCNVSDGLVFIPGIDGYMNCLDAETGAIRWRYRSDASTCSEPLVDGERVYFGGWDRYYYAFNKRTGKLLWKHQMSGSSDSGVSIAHKGRIYLPVGGGIFRCLDGATGEVLWTPPVSATIYNVTPAYYEGLLFMSALHGRGLAGVPIGAGVYALCAQDGSLVWSHEGGGLTGPVVGANGRLYYASSVNPFFYCVDAHGNGDGTTTCHWRLRMGAKVEESTPALYDGMAFILNSDAYLYAIE